MAPPPAKLSASNSSSSLADHFPNLRQFFQRSASQPSQYHDSHANVNASSSSVTSGAPASPPRRASAAPSFSSLSSASSSSSSSVDLDADARMHAFGSCTQVLATAITALFRAINTFGVYQPESAVSDNTTTRRAKLLYVQLLDKAQRERGEWRGFADSSSSSNRDAADTTQKKSNESALNILSTHLRDLSRDETFALLNELVDVSFRSIRGPLVSSEIYLKHKRPLAALSLDIPVSLHALLEIRGILNQLGRDEKLCVFRLLTLWHAMAVVNEAQDLLRRTIQEKHHLVFSDCTELEFLTTRKDPRHDAVAIALLHVLVLYHDVLFSDVEFLLIKQELQLSQSLRRPRVEAADAEETDEPKANAPSEDSTQTESSSLSPSQGEQTETESEHLDEETKSDDVPDAAAKEQSSAMRTTGAGSEAAEDSGGSKEEVPREVAVQAAAPPSPSHTDGQTVHDDTVDATKWSAKLDESNTTSSSLNEEVQPLPPSPAAVAAVQTVDAEPTQSEERSAALEQEAEAPNIASAAAATENVLEQRSPQPKSEELLLDASSHSVARVSPSALSRSQSTNPPHHHHAHGSARGHGPVVSIRPHSLLPRKTRQSKRFQFESLTVSTATTITAATNEKKQKQHNHHNSSNSSSSKSNDARQATLLSDVVQIVDYFGASSKEPVARKSGNGSANSGSSAAPVAIVRIQQRSPEAKDPSSNDGSAQRQSPLSAARAASTKGGNNQEPHAEAEEGKEDERKAGNSDSSAAPPVKRASITKPPSPRPHEITDLANTYFSFSFAAATMRTMAIMAVYAIRKHQHNHHQQHE